MAGDLVGAHAHAVIVDVVLEVLLLLRHDDLQDRAHRLLVAIEHFLHAAHQLIDAEPRGHLAHAAFGHAQRRDDRVEVRLVPLGQPAIAQDQVQHLLIELPLAIDLDRRDLDAFLEDLRRIGGQAAGHLAADVGHVAEHRAPGDDAPVDVDRHQREPVVQMAHRAVAAVRIVGEEDVAFFDVALIAGDEPGEERTELAHHHLAVRIGDHRERVVLFANARRHRGAEQHRVHLGARVLQRVLDDVERDRIDIDLAERPGVRLDDGGWHRACLVSFSCVRGACVASRSRVCRYRSASVLLRRTDQDVAHRIHFADVIGQDQRGGVHLDHDRGAGNAIARLEQRTVVDARLMIAPFEEDRRLLLHCG